jgi:hypothetical protein
MRVCLTLSRAHALAHVEDRVFAFLKHLEEQCDSISSCEVFVEGAPADRGNPGGCMVRLALNVLGEQVNVTGTNSTTCEAPLPSALRSAYRKAVRALRLMSQKHHACSCHSAAAA